MPRNEVLLRKSTVAKLNASCIPELGWPAPEWIVPVNEIIFVSRQQILDWCRLAYPGHPKGCPNAYGKCHIEDGSVTAAKIDLTKPKWIVYGVFNVDAHAARMKDNHPKWSRRQCRNSRRWQPSSLARMNDRVDEFLSLVQPQQYGILTYLGESDGVHLWRTARRAGIPMERIKDMSICRHMALFCFLKETS